MSNKPFPALCRECKYSAVDKTASWNLRCGHPIVNGSDPWALTATQMDYGSSCKDEREKKFFSRCGMSGKLWEAKEVSNG